MMPRKTLQFVLMYQDSEILISAKLKRVFKYYQITLYTLEKHLKIQILNGNRAQSEREKMQEEQPLTP